MRTSACNHGDNETCGLCRNWNLGATAGSPDTIHEPSSGSRAGRSVKYGKCDKCGMEGCDVIGSRCLYEAGCLRRQLAACESHFNQRCQELQVVSRALAAVTAERDQARQSWRGAISLLEERTAERDAAVAERDRLLDAEREMREAWAVLNHPNFPVAKDERDSCAYWSHDSARATLNRHLGCG